MDDPAAPGWFGQALFCQAVGPRETPHCRDSACPPWFNSFPGAWFFRWVEGTHPWIVNALRNWSNAASIVKRMNRRCFWQIGLFQAGMFDATTISDRSYLSGPRIGN